MGNRADGSAGNAAEDVFYLTPDTEVSSQSTAREIPAADTSTSDDYSFSNSFGPQASSKANATGAATSFDLRGHLNSLAHLVANITEAYSAVIFTADPKTQTLHLTGAHSLSRDLIDDAEIGYGSGLVGWTAENSVRVSVCPFEHDATTLLYYTEDQDLKSFIAVPILSSPEKGAQPELLGVIACDSKKSYAFAKVTEKLLADCAREASILMELHGKLSVRTKHELVNTPLLKQVLDSLRSHDSEVALLTAAAKIPNELIARDALVVVTAAEAGIGKGTFYSAARGEQIEHRLLELVCKHKKIICPERSVHALPTDDIKQRSFLSIPFHTLDREAGSINLLSKPYEAFEAKQIAAVEEIAALISRELERIRLREKFAADDSTTGVLSWRHFSIQARDFFTEARAQHVSLSLLRISVRNISELEEAAGIDATTQALQKLTRLVDQVKRSPALACSLYGTEMLVLCEAKDVDVFIRRLCTQIERLTFEDVHAEQFVTGNQLGELLLNGIQFIITKYPRDGETLNELTAKALRLARQGAVEKEGASNVRHRR